ncbi:RNase adapter RapZ [Salinisphaera japonica]|uniref:GlmZ(SRNA)-inactivating NTPase n=1 Tax=Salinisphaera japonica YTM-1 TaxID=1209778 RepID=A0A423PV32_9GAMM|nr:RNase adapter RapZ [Salinisphaera japonica]ROO29392.1 glmZ(sRNA)-inactivating NTPase [Salinisphaera japonica YTM-1]
MRLTVVSGLAGAGKSVALNMLEDLGYYCIDNLPLGLLGEVSAETLHRQGLDFDRLAVGVDARAREAEIGHFAERIDTLRAAGIDLHVLYLYADEKTILRRYSETRRRHPLTGDNRTLVDAVAADIALTRPIAEKADVSIDTSRLNIHQLRDLVRNEVEGRVAGELAILVQSFGFKYGLPPAVDFVFDVRCLPNPHWVPELRALTGRDQPVIDHLDAQPALPEMRDHIAGFLTRWLPDFAAQDRTYITVAIGCTGGKHRSVYLAEAVAACLRADNDHVLVRHNEL